MLDMAAKFEAHRRLSPKLCSCRERKRSKSEAARTLAGTAPSTAASTVQRPSPESSTSLHFESKQDGPLLQIADACAFGIRRFFAKQDFGTEFVRAIFGSDFPNVDDWDGPGTGQAFMWRA